MSAILLELQEVSYIREGTPILQGVSWRVGEGEHWLVLGPNGAGKSTLAKIALGYEWPSSGAVLRFGRRAIGTPIGELRRQIGFFQPALLDAHGVFHPDATALDILLTGLDGSLARYRDFAAGEIDRAQALFDTAFQRNRGFSSARAFALLSAGERRKILLLRALIARPPLLILDEPFESLDLAARFELEQLLDEYRAAGLQMVMILHRLEEVPPFLSHALLLKAGIALESGPIESALTSERLTELYKWPLRIHRLAGRYSVVPENSTGTE